jgi:Xaa-Pro aminopeptidase
MGGLLRLSARTIRATTKDVATPPATPFSSRRERLLSSIGPQTAAVFVATPTAIRNNDVEHDFRQDSDVFYLTGFDEPDTVIVLSPQGQLKDAEGKTSPAKFTMFVRPKSFFAPSTP